MSDRSFDDERRLRRAAVTRFGQVPDADATGEPADGPAEEPVDDHGMGDLAAKTGGDPDTDDNDDNAASMRMEQQTLWVDFQVRKAMERGEFDDLPGAGKPLKLDETHDPNWWLRKLVERENVAVLPPGYSKVAYTWSSTSRPSFQRATEPVPWTNSGTAPKNQFTMFT